MSSTMPFGASPVEWKHFAEVLGLASDLLPVVSNPDAIISEQSKLTTLGKTPSRYNSVKRATGFTDWTSKQTTPQEIAIWSQQPDYGICIQTRTIHAIDVDVTNKTIADEVEQTLRGMLPGACVRYRSNSSKFLLPVRVTGCQTPLTKRSFTAKLGVGIVEFLAHGQQFVALGTHQEGVRYAWRDEQGPCWMPASFPEISAETFEELWSLLVHVFSDSGKDRRRREAVVRDLAASDPVAQHLIDTGRVRSQDRGGAYNVVCPWEDEHTSPVNETATQYFPAHTGGYALGHFKCLHAHCDGRTREEFLEQVGFSDALLEFEDYTLAPAASVEEGEAPAEGVPAVKRARFAVELAHQFVRRPQPGWIMRGWLPKAGLCVLYGPSGAGKTFMALDMAAACVTGATWRGVEVKPTRCVYICAEGAGGFRNRLDAYLLQHDLRPELFEMGVIVDAPNILVLADVKDLIRSLREFGDVGLVVVDTLAQVTPGGNENSGEDMGRALSHLKALHRATGALVMVVHHSGKDAAKGARGWSGVRAAADAELEVVREEGVRKMTVSKMKDGADGESFTFGLAEIGIDVDGEGYPVTSCVVDHNVSAPTKPRRNDLKGVAAVVKDAAKELIGLSPRDDVAVSELIDLAAERVVWDPTKPDRRRKQVLDAMDKMRESGQLAVFGNRVQVLGE